MKNIKNIFNREFAAYFNAPIAYIFIIVFLAVNSGLFMTSFFLAGTADMRGFFSLLPIALIIFIPAISMRLWAEDARGGTLALLHSFPIKSSQLVLGKFFASFVFYLLALAGTLIIPIMIIFLGNPDLGPIIGGYFGAALLGAFFLSVGIFISSLFKDQIIAFILSMVACSI
jgi:ABC-2 type transport system permease protein